MIIYSSPYFLNSLLYISWEEQHTVCLAMTTGFCGSIADGHSGAVEKAAVAATADLASAPDRD